MKQNTEQGRIRRKLPWPSMNWCPQTTCITHVKRGETKQARSTSRYGGQGMLALGTWNRKNKRSRIAPGHTRPCKGPWCKKWFVKITGKAQGREKTRKQMNQCKTVISGSKVYRDQCTIPLCGTHMYMQMCAPKWTPVEDWAWLVSFSLRCSLETRFLTEHGPRKPG